MRELKHEKLYIIGAGTDEVRLKKLAPDNVIFLGKISDEDLRKYVSSAKAFLYAAIEDFGIVMVESLAAGTPIIAYGKGGALDIVNDKTGMLFPKLTEDSFKQTLENFNAKSFSPDILKNEAKKFSEPEFKQKLLNEIHGFYDQ